MRSGTTVRLLALCAAVSGVLLTGCRSATAPPPREGGGVLAFDGTLDGDGRRAAREHAAFATGIHYWAVGEDAEAEGCFLAALGEAPDNAEYAVRAAMAMARQRKVRESLEFGEAFAAAHPGAAAMWRWLGAAYAKAGEWEAAGEKVRRAVEAEPGDPEGWLLLSAVASRGGEDARRSLEVLEEGLEKAEPPTALREQMMRAYSALCGEYDDDAPESAELHRGMIVQLRAIEEESPGDPDNLKLLSALLLFEGEAEEGLRTLARLERLGAPEEGEEAWRTAFRMVPARNAEPTLEALRGLREKGEAPEEAWLLEAALAELAGRPEEAAAALRQAVEESPHDVELWRRHATGVSGDPERMLSVLDDALKANPDHPSLLELRGVAKLLLHRYSAGAKDLLRAAEGFEGRTDVEPNENFNLALALALTRTGRHAEAAEWLEKAWEADGAGALEAFVSDASFVAGNGPRAMAKTVQEFIRRTDDPEAKATGHTYLAMSHLDHKQYKAAAREFAKNDEYYPDARSVPARLAYMHAVALDLAGRKAEAAARLEALAEIHPRFAEARNYLAYTWAVAGVRLEDARRHVEAALAEDPANAAYLDTLAWVLYRMGAYEEAWENIELADRLRPGDEEIGEHKEAIRAALDAAEDGAEGGGNGEK